MEKSCSSTREVRDSIVHGQATSGSYYSAIRWRCRLKFARCYLYVFSYSEKTHEAALCHYLPEERAINKTSWNRYSFLRMVTAGIRPMMS